MKKFLLAFTLSLTLGFTACSDDDNDDRNELSVTVNDIEGDFIGKMNCDVTVKNMITPVDYEAVKAIAKKNSDNKTLTMTIKDFSYQNLNYGDIIVRNVIVNEKESTISGTDTTVLVKNGAPYKAPVSLIGKYDKNNQGLELDVDMTLPVNPNMTIIFDIFFKGEKE